VADRAVSLREIKAPEGGTEAAELEATFDLWQT
jgi:hypothetical protein